MHIKNGMIIDPENKKEYVADILIKKGKIVSIQNTGSMSTINSGSGSVGGFAQGNPLPGQTAQIGHDDTTNADNIEVIDAMGLMIGPGLIDTHVHFRDPGFIHKEDIITGAEAAKAGGYTQVIMMANTNPCIDNAETLHYVLDKGASTGIKVRALANVTYGMKGKELTYMKALKDAGALGFTDDGIPLKDPDIVLAAMKECAELGVPISFHEEDPELIENNGINKGKASEYYNVGGSPREAEISLIKRDIELARMLEKTAAGRGESDKVCFVIQHISTKEGVELVRQAKKAGLDIHAEATPHHFSLTEDAVIEHGTNAKMNPPLRTEEDRLAIIEGLKDGTIDMIATDHAPHAKEEKDRPITEAPSGIIGLETALSLAIKNLVNTKALTYPMLFDRMSYAPAKLYGLSGGTISEGADADLVIFDPEKMRTYGSFRSRSSNSPFLKKTLPGTVLYTICRGKTVYKAGIE